MDLMKGMGQIVTWSIRDETLHVENVSRLLESLLLKIQTYGQTN